MTECERIIEQGILPASFFQEEERCGFLVTEKRKKIWAIELDIYLKFAEVCKRHNLTYWGDGGTLLGAVRHNGFIPWDDDMDIIMPRKDYNKLLEIGGEEFEEPYFLQTPHTDSNYGYSFAKLRNCNSTCIPYAFAKSGFNHGIHIDIFPLDTILLEDGEENYRKINSLNLENSALMKMQNKLNDGEEGVSLSSDKIHNTLSIYDEIQKIASMHEAEVSPYLGTMVITVIDFKRKLLPAIAFQDTIVHAFEGYNISIPLGFDLVLKTEFGDYMKLPSIETRGLWHNNVLFDPDKKYICYVK